MNNFTFTREIDDKTKSEVNSLLGDWIKTQKNSPISQLRGQCSSEYVYYTIEIDIQIEERWLGEVTLPNHYVETSCKDPWEVTFNLEKDFQTHGNKYVIKNTGRNVSCNSCSGSGRHTCESCNGSGLITCNVCWGTGRNSCPHCGGHGSFSRSKQESVLMPCRYCSGKGTHGTPNGPINCSECNGRGSKVELQTQQYNESCNCCGGIGQVTCNSCRGGKITCGSCQGRGFQTCITCNGAGNITVADAIELKESPIKNAACWRSDSMPSSLGLYAPDKLKSQNVFYFDSDGDQKTKLDSLLAIECFKHTIDSARLQAKAAVEWCKGRLIRERVSLLACRFVKFDYEYEGSQYSIWINYDSREVEDCGVIKKSEEEAEAAAKRRSEKLAQIKNSLKRALGIIVAITCVVLFSIVIIKAGRGFYTGSNISSDVGGMKENEAPRQQPQRSNISSSVGGMNAGVGLKQVSKIMQLEDKRGRKIQVEIFEIANDKVMIRRTTDGAEYVIPFSNLADSSIQKLTQWQKESFIASGVMVDNVSLEKENNNSGGSLLMTQKRIAGDESNIYISPSIKSKIDELQGSLALVNSKIEAEQRRWHDANNIINALTNNRTTPVRRNSPEHIQMYQSQVIMKQVEAGAPTLKEEKSRLEDMLKALQQSPPVK